MTSLQDTFRDIWLRKDKIIEPQKVISGTEVIPNIVFWLDPEGEQEVTCGATRGQGFNVKSTVTRPGRWLGLHFVLGKVDFSQVGMIGFFARTYSEQPLTWRACLRSHKRGGFVDHFFEKEEVSCAAPSTHLDALEIARQSRIPLGSVGRELIIFFHVESFDITLQDMRLFCA